LATPSLLPVKGLNKQEILQAFQARIENNPDAEFTEACRQVEKIAILRLRDKL
jgi:urate oxidase